MVEGKTLSKDVPNFKNKSHIYYNQNCASCHGKDGKGDTKMGKKSKVLDYTNPDVQKKFDPVKAFNSVRDGIQENEKDRMKPYGEKLKLLKIKIGQKNIMTKIQKKNVLEVELLSK